MERKRRILSRFAGIAKGKGERFGRSLQLCMLFLLCSFGQELVLELAGNGLPSRTRAAGLLAGYGYSLFLALPLALAVALVAAPWFAGPDSAGRLRTQRQLV